MKPIIAFDTETFRIGPGAVSPKLVCVSIAFRGPDGQIQTMLTGNGDACIVDDLRDLLAPGHILVAHNTPFDLLTIATSYPELWPLVWEKVMADEIDDTKTREKLLNLSKCGKLDRMLMPDGSWQVLNYGLDVLVAKYLGLDISADKVGDDVWRLNYDTLDGLPASKYPADAKRYAVDDAVYALQVYEAQEGEIESESEHASCSVSKFQTAADFALGVITTEGIEVDPERFQELKAKLEDELSNDSMEPLIAAGLMTPARPPVPYVKQAQRALELLEEGKGRLPAEAIDADGNVKFHQYQTALEAAGIKFKAAEKSSISKKALIEMVLQVSERIARPVKMTDKGNVSCDSEVIEALADHDPVLEIYRQRQELQKLVTTEIPAMMWEGQPAKRVHVPFNALVETGRTSSRTNKLYPSMNGQQRDPRARPIFKATDGWLLFSCDYSGLELCSVAQTTYDLFGFSVHREKINSGYDLHAFLGCNLAYHLDPWFKSVWDDMPEDLKAAFSMYDIFMEMKAKDAKFFKHWRKFAKPVGLGYPGGLGPFKLLTLAKKTYGVDITAVAKERFTENPDEFEITKRVLYYAKKLFKMKEDDFVWNDLMLGIALADRLREIWLETYPEMRRYFEHIQDECGDPHNEVIGEEEVEDSPDETKEIAGFCYTTPMGMHRAGCSYTAAANGKAMQSPSAEGAKMAVVGCVRAATDPTLESILYGCRIVNFIHDEIMGEVPDDEFAHDRVMEVCSIMEDKMRCIMPDVQIKATPTLMRRWFKEAEPVYDGRTKRLVPWEKDAQYDVADDGTLYLKGTKP